MKKTIQVIALAILPTITFAKDSNLIVSTKENVQRQLKDPQSAQFRDVKVVINTLNEKTVCGEVNAKNSYGGYTGFKPFYTIDGQNITFVDNSAKLYEYKKNLAQYSKAGCLGEVEEKTARKREELKKVCDANYDFLHKVIAKRKKPEVAYTELLESNELGFTPSKESMFSELEKFKADEKQVREMKNSPSYYGTYREECITENMNK